jgi:hypothetical protein
VNKRFKNRWICVTETQHVVKKTTFSYRSYARYGDASSAVDKVNKHKSVFTRAYVVDRDNSPNVLLP